MLFILTGAVTSDSVSEESCGFDVAAAVMVSGSVYAASILSAWREKIFRVHINVVR